MNAILKAFPSAIGKAGKEIMTTHRDKIARVVDCAAASEKELRDPKKFEEWLGVSSKAAKFSITKKIPSENELLKRLSVTVTIIDYQKIGKAVDKATKFLSKASTWDPSRNIESRLDFAYVFYDQFKKDRRAKKDKLTLEKNAEWTAEEMIAIAWDLAEAKSHILAWQVNAPKLAKIYGGYSRIFSNAERALYRVSEILDGHLELSSLRATLLSHYNAIKDVRSKLDDAQKNANTLSTKINRLKPKIETAMQEAHDVLTDVAPYAKPALVNKAKRKLNEAVKPFSNVLKQMFGISK